MAVKWVKFILINVLLLSPIGIKDRITPQNTHKQQTHTKTRTYLLLFGEWVCFVYSYHNLAL